MAAAAAAAPAGSVRVLTSLRVCVVISLSNKTLHMNVCHSGMVHCTESSCGATEQDSGLTTGVGSVKSIRLSTWGAACASPASDLSCIRKRYELRQLTMVTFSDTRFVLCPE